MSNTSASSPSDRFKEAVAWIYQHFLDNELPIDYDVIQKRYPDFAPELISFVDGIKDIEKIAHQTPQANPAPPAGTVQKSDDPMAVSEDYELLDELGHGGMGVVYKARQTKLKRIVAVKMILTGKFATPAEIQLFHWEAEAVAALDHPGIVPIYETGTHEGRHFFSMKYMEGGTLASKRANYRHPRAAATVVRTVALAVHYAHQHGILHRDLKPANILLDLEGKPAVSDFGLARPLTNSELKQHNVAAGTPSYMAPEQAINTSRHVSTAADVYSLGAILYELLTDETPFHSKLPHVKVTEMTDSILVSPRSVNSAVPRDLDAICVKCLSQDPSQRFASVAELADELERWLNGKPIQSRRIRVWEHAYRWVRRNPVPSALGAALAASIIVGLSIARMQWLRAEREAMAALNERDIANRERDAAARERDIAASERERAKANLARAQEAIDFIGRQVSSEILDNVPHADKVRRTMIEYTIRFHEGFLADSGNEPGVRKDAAMAYMRTGELRARLGTTKDAIEALKKALALYETLHEELPDDAIVMKGLISCWYRLITVYVDTGNVTEAEKAFAKCEALHRQVKPSDANAMEHEQARAALLDGRLRLHMNANHFDEAEAAGQEARAIYQRLLQVEPGDHQLLVRLARLQGLRGWNLKKARRYPEAKEAYLNGIALFTARLRASPLDPLLRAEFATAHRNYGILLRQTGEYSEAQSEYRTAQQIMARVVDDFPEVPYYRSEWAESLFGQALVNVELGELPEALLLLDRAVELQREAYSKASDRVDIRRRFVHVLIMASQTAIDHTNTDHAKVVSQLAELRPLAEISMDFTTTGQMLLTCIQLARRDEKLTEEAKKKAVEKYTAEYAALVQRARDESQEGWIAMLDDPRVREMPPHPALTRMLEARKTATTKPGK